MWRISSSVFLSCDIPVIARVISRKVSHRNHDSRRNRYFLGMWIYFNSYYYLNGCPFKIRSDSLIYWSLLVIIVNNIATECFSKMLLSAVLQPFPFRPEFISEVHNSWTICRFNAISGSVWTMRILHVTCVHSLQRANSYFFQTGWGQPHVPIIRLSDQNASRKCRSAGTLIKFRQAASNVR